MRRTFTGFILLALLTLTAAPSRAQRKPAAQEGKGKTAASKPKTPAAKPAAKPTSKPADEDTLKAELDEIIKLDAATRVERLSAFVKANPDTPQTLRARELLTSARAALGDERLRAGDRAAGVELFRTAVREAPDEMSDKLFAEIVAQLPANLFL